jgi:hypothetical protein
MHTFWNSRYNQQLTLLGLQISHLQWELILSKKFLERKEPKPIKRTPEED